MLKINRISKIILDMDYGTIIKCIELHESK